MNRHNLKHSHISSAIALASFGIHTAEAHPIPAAAIYRLDCPNFYVQAGLEVNPAFGAHPFILPLPVCVAPPLIEEWSTPTTLTYSAGVVGKTGSSTHMIALHAGEAAPATTWTYSLTRALPAAGPFAVETRIRRSIVHPGGPHVDAYMAVVGALLGTVPGPSLAPRFVLIGGSLGKHMDTPPPPAPQPIYYGGSTLKPPSGLPSPGNQDYPCGEVLTLLDTNSGQLGMLVVANGMTSLDITNVWVRHGQNGPILMDLRPVMHQQSPEQYATVLTLEDFPLPLGVVQIMAQDQAYISVKFSPLVHPEGEITGALTTVPCKAGDANCDGVTNIDDLVMVITQWGVCRPPCEGDLNHDGVVNIDDLVLVITNWG